MGDAGVSDDSDVSLVRSLSLMMMMHSPISPAVTGMAELRCSSRVPRRIHSIVSTQCRTLLTLILSRPPLSSSPDSSNVNYMCVDFDTRPMCRGSDIIRSRVLRGYYTRTMPFPGSIPLCVVDLSHLGCGCVHLLALMHGRTLFGMIGLAFRALTRLNREVSRPPAGG